MTRIGSRDLAARLELLETSVKAGTEVRYAVINDGPTPILTGGDYELRRRTDDGWEQVNLRIWFTAVGIMIGPSERRELRAPIPEHVIPGDYQIRKSFLVQNRFGGLSNRDSKRAELVADLRIAER